MGEGNEFRFDRMGVPKGLMGVAEDERDGNSWESLSEPEVFFLVRGGREPVND